MFSRAGHEPPPQHRGRRRDGRASSAHTIGEHIRTTERRRKISSVIGCRVLVMTASDNPGPARLPLDNPYYKADTAQPFSRSEFRSRPQQSQPYHMSYIRHMTKGNLCGRSPSSVKKSRP
ncbi:protein of unknown function [Pararobbsia alpina]